MEESREVWGGGLGDKILTDRVSGGVGGGVTPPMSGGVSCGVVPAERSLLET